MKTSTYSVATPVFDGNPTENPSGYVILGHAKTAEEALAIYAMHFNGTGARPIKAIMASPELRRQGPVAGWIPNLADE